MDSTKIKLVSYLLFLGITLITGGILNKFGTPYKKRVLGVHKLATLGILVAGFIITYDDYINPGLSVHSFAITIASTIGLLGVLYSGIKLIYNGGHITLILTHKISSLAVIFYSIFLIVKTLKS